MTENHEKYFRAYISQIIELTFGFTPIVIIDFPSKNTLQVTLDGEESQRAQMMGREGKNLHALKMLFRIYAKRNDYSSAIYVKPPTDEYGNSKTTPLGYIE